MLTTNYPSPIKKLTGVPMLERIAIGKNLFYIFDHGIENIILVSVGRLTVADKCALIIQQAGNLL
jgi:hypothetical protein